MNLLSKTPKLLTLILLWLAASTQCVAQEQKKIEYSLLVDSTGSMRSQFDTVIALAREIVKQSHERGPVSIYRFHSERIYLGLGRPPRAIPKRIIERTQERVQLNRALDDIYIEGGQTTLLDAVDLMVNHLNEPPAAAKKVITLITDGEDRVSTTKRKDLLEKLAASKTHIYAIGLVRELEGGKRSKATSLLESLAKQSGGQVVFLKTDHPDLQKLLSELAIPIQ